MKGWKVTQLDEVVKIQNGFAFNSKQFSPNAKTPLIRIRDLKKGANTETNFDGDFDASYLVKKGDFLIGMDGEFGCYEWHGEEALLNQRVCRLHSFASSLDARFLFRGINKYLKDIEEVTGFTTVKHISSKQIASIQFPLPPLPEQRRIVAFLDEAFEGLEAMRANAEKNLKNARELFDSYLNAIFTQKGEGWVENSLAELCTIKHGFAFQSEFFTDSGEYTLLTPGNFFESGGYRYRGDKQKYYVGEIPNGFVLSAGDLLVAMTEQATGLLGSPVIIPKSGKFLHNQRLGLVVAKDGAPWSNEFFFYVFNTMAVREEIQASASGVKVRHTSPSKMGEILVAYPSSIAAQSAIVDELTNMAEQASHLESLCRQKLAAIAELKQSLLQKAFAGELTQSESIAA